MTLVQYWIASERVTEWLFIKRLFRLIIAENLYREIAHLSFIVTSMWSPSWNVCIACLTSAATIPPELPNKYFWITDIILFRIGTHGSKVELWSTELTSDLIGGRNGKATRPWSKSPLAFPSGYGEPHIRNFCTVNPFTNAIYFAACGVQNWTCVIGK